MIFTLGAVLWLIGKVGSELLESPFYTSTRDKFIWLPVAIIGALLMLYSILSLTWSYLP